MSMAELRMALGVSEALLNEALWLLSFPGDKRISFPAKDRVSLGPEWVERCEGRTSQGARPARRPARIYPVSKSVPGPSYRKRSRTVRIWPGGWRG
jgi:hypothetical protein